MSNEIESNRLPRRDGIRWLVEERASQDDDVSLIQLLRVEITNTFWAFAHLPRMSSKLVFRRQNKQNRKAKSITFSRKMEDDIEGRKRERERELTIKIEWLSRT